MLGRETAVAMEGGVEGKGRRERNKDKDKVDKDRKVQCTYM